MSPHARDLSHKSSFCGLPSVSPLSLTSSQCSSVQFEHRTYLKHIFEHRTVCPFLYSHFSLCGVSPNGWHLRIVVGCHAETVVPACLSSVFMWFDYQILATVTRSSPVLKSGFAQVYCECAGKYGDGSISLIKQRKSEEREEAFKGPKISCTSQAWNAGAFDPTHLCCTFLNAKSPIKGGKAATPNWGDEILSNTSFFSNWYTLLQGCWIPILFLLVKSAMFKSQTSPD